MSKFFTVYENKKYYKLNIDHIVAVRADYNKAVVELVNGSKIVFRDGKKEENFYRIKFLKAYEEAVKTQT